MAARHKYRLKCQTINKQNKLPCKAKGYLTKKGTIRCRLHGGYSTGPKSVEGKIKAIHFARENNIPFLGLCYGLQLAVVEFARNVCNLEEAHSTEINKIRVTR